MLIPLTSIWDGGVKLRDQAARACIDVHWKSVETPAVTTVMRLLRNWPEFEGGVLLRVL